MCSLNFSSMTIFILRNFIESVESIVFPFIFTGVPTKFLCYLFGFTIISFNVNQSTAVFDSFSRSVIRSSKLDV